jgi:hypothetical protein
MVLKYYSNVYHTLIGINRFYFLVPKLTWVHKYEEERDELEITAILFALICYLLITCFVYVYSAFPLWRHSLFDLYSPSCNTIMQYYVTKEYD